MTRPQKSYIYYYDQAAIAKLPLVELLAEISFIADFYLNNTEFFFHRKLAKIAVDTNAKDIYEFTNQIFSDIIKHLETIAPPNLLPATLTQLQPSIINAQYTELVAYYKYANTPKPAQSKPESKSVTSLPEHDIANLELVTLTKPHDTNNVT